MRIVRNTFARGLWVAVLGLLLAGPLAAQFVSIEGQVLDLEGKPFPGVTIIVTSKEGGMTLETKTEKGGQFYFSLPRPGQWTLQVKIKDQIAHERILVVRTQNNERTLINFKEIAASQSAELQEARKKQEEEKAKFQGMKEHFDSGRAALESATATKSLISKTPATERGPLTEKLTEQSTLAVNELEAAQKAAPPNEPNLHIVMSNLGQAYELAGRPDDAATAFGKAVELKPDNPSYYQGMGTALARAGKVTEAMATCEKAGKLPTQPGAPDAAQVAATCYGNVGIILQNSSRMKESVEPLKKATQVNPNYPDYWFLLGGALMNTMESKMEGGKMIAVVQPGTAEAYQKYLELAPTGHYAQEAKENLETLKVLGVGIDTKVTNKKTKKP